MTVLNASACFLFEDSRENVADKRRDLRDGFAICFRSQEVGFLFFKVIQSLTDDRKGVTRTPLPAWVYLVWPLHAPDLPGVAYLLLEASQSLSVSTGRIALKKRP